MTEQEAKDYNAQELSKMNGTRVCPHCGYCPTCGRPIGNWNFPQNPQYPYPGQHQFTCKSEVSNGS